MPTPSTRAATVVSRDGTTIAYWMTGQGPPLVLVHGTVSNHMTWDPVLPLLKAHRTLYAIDRRGRGGSGDADDYDLSREFEDVATVVDLAAETSGAGVDLFGHSFGGVCAFGAARRTSQVRRLALYEGWPNPYPENGPASDAALGLIAQHLSAGDDDAALETFFRQVVHLSDEEVRGLRANAAWWQSRVEAAHTIIREGRAMRSAELDPEEASGLRIPVLLLVGADSPDNLRGTPEALDRALPDARIEELEGQHHLAHTVAPDLFAGRLLAFLDQPDA